MIRQEHIPHPTVSSITRDECWIGAYVLHIDVVKSIAVRAGRYNGGGPIHLHKGRYLYVGSAMGNANGLYLPKRLLRHSRRSRAGHEHACYTILRSHFVDLNIDERRLVHSSIKKLRWNIDYVLDNEAVELSAVTYVQSMDRLENIIVEQLEQNESASAPYLGFGAHDHPGHSHFFALTSNFDWTYFVAVLRAQFERS